MKFFQKLQSFVTTTAIGLTIAASVAVSVFPGVAQARPMNDSNSENTEQVTPPKNMEKSRRTKPWTKSGKSTKTNPKSSDYVKPVPPIDDWTYGPDNFDKNGFNPEGLSRDGKSRYDSATGKVVPVTPESSGNPSPYPAPSPDVWNYDEKGLDRNRVDREGYTEDRKMRYDPISGKILPVTPDSETSAPKSGRKLFNKKYHKSTKPVTPVTPPVTPETPESPQEPQYPENPNSDNNSGNSDVVDTVPVIGDGYDQNGLDSNGFDPQGYNFDKTMRYDPNLGYAVPVTPANS